MNILHIITFIITGLDPGNVELCIGTRILKASDAITVQGTLNNEIMHDDLITFSIDSHTFALPLRLHSWADAHSDSY